jgi:hypothetical protein
MTKKLLKKIRVEEAPANCAGGGSVAGLGIGAQGEPGVDKKKKKGPVLGRNIWRRKANV